MSNITSQNNLRYCIDTLNTKTSGVVVSNNDNFVNLTRASRVTGITIAGAQPANTYRYFAFNIGGVWGKLNSSGSFAAFTENNATFSNIEAYGNTPTDLRALSNIPGLAGQSFGVAIALAADDPQNAVPSAAIAFSCVNDSQQLVTTEYSPVYELGDNAQLTNYEAITPCSNGGSVSITAQIRGEDGQTSAWTNPTDLKGKAAKAVQFKAVYSSTQPGVSSAQVSSASYIYAKGNSVVPGSSAGEIITQTLDWFMPIHNCRLTVFHEEFVDTGIKCFVAFRNSPVQVRKESLGIGTGTRKTFQLAHTNGIKYDTFCLYYDGVKVFSDLELNCEVGRVTCNAPSGVTVSCDYDYNWDLEEWQEMTLISRALMGDYYKSEYKLATSSNSKTAAAIKIQLLQQTGHINNEVLGTATGTAKSFKLAHIVNDGSISITANNAALAAKYWRLLEEPQYVSVAATAGQVVRASYDWISEPPRISQFSVVFSE